MAKNRWYTAEQDAYIARRIRELQVRKLPYGRRKAGYQKIAQEFQRTFGVNRSWNGVQQRARALISMRMNRGGSMIKKPSRIVASLTAFTFFFLQFLSPYASAQQDELPTWLRKEQGGWVSSEQAEHLEHAEKELLHHLASLENSRPRYVATQPSSGLQGQYAGRELVVARDADGDLLFLPTLDDYQKIKNGTLLLVDGALQTIKNGKLARQVAVDGTDAFFRADGWVDHEIAADGTRTDYSYDLAGDGTLRGFTRSTRQPAGLLTQLYDADGRLRVELFPDGSLSGYSPAGMLSWGQEAGVLYRYSEVGAPAPAQSLSEAVAEFSWIYLGRKASAGDLSHWVDAGLSRDEVEAGIANSLESKTRAIPLLFQRYLFRAASAAEIGYWKGLPTLKAIEAGIADTTESKFKNIPILCRWYLFRAPTAAEVMHWSMLPTFQQMKDGIKNSAESKSKWIPLFYQRYLGRSPTASERDRWLNSGLVLDQIEMQILSDPEALAKGRVFVRGPSGIGAANLPQRLIYGLDGWLQEATQVDGAVIRFSGGMPVESVSAGGVVTQLSADQQQQILNRLTPPVVLPAPPDGLWRQGRWPVTADKLAPTGLVISPELTNQRDVSLTLAFTDPAAEDGTDGSGVAAMRFSLNRGRTWSAPEPAAAAKTISLAGPDGNYVLQAQFQDAAGNWSEPATQRIRLDTIPPSVTLTSPTVTNQRSYMLTYRVDGTVKSEPVTLAEEANRLTRTISDAAGNQTVVQWTITLDTIPPAVTLISPAVTNQRNYALTYTVDGVVKSEPMLLTEGANWINKIIADAAGNRTFVRWTLRLDTTPPVVALASPTTVAAELYQARVVVDGRPAGPEQWRLGRGTHQLIVQATDPAGNSAWSRIAVTRTGDLPALTDSPVLSGVEGPEGRQMTQRLADGSVATFVNGQLVMVTTAAGARLLSPTMDPAGTITGGWLVTPEGTTTLLQAGRALWSRDARGTVTWYFSDGQVEAMRTADGKATRFAYRLDAQGKITGVLTTTEGLSLLQDAGGTPLVELDAGGRRMTFEDGRLNQIATAGLAPIVYTQTGQPDGTIVNERPAGAATDLPKRFLYAADGSLQEVTQADGTVIRLNSGMPVEMVAADGSVTTLTVAQADDLLGSFVVARDGIARTYNGQGGLTSLTLADHTTVELTGDALTGLMLPDGTRVTDGIFDADNHLVGGEVTLPDGRSIRYADGKPAEAHLPDGSVIGYGSDGQPAQLTLASGLAYGLSQVTSTEGALQWVGTLSGTAPPPEGTLTRLVYLQDWTLQEATRSDGATLRYQGSRLNTLTQSDGTVLSYTYDEAGRLLNTMAASPDPAQPAIRTEYAYDKIRRVLKGDALLYDYSYEFDPDGSEITVIHEVATGLMKRYQAGQLRSQTDADGAVTRYEYTTNPSGYLDPMETAIGATQTLPDGRVVSYRKENGAASGWVVEQVILPDGRTFKLSNGQVVSVTLPDGRRYDRTDPVEPNVLPEGNLTWSNGDTGAPDGWSLSDGSGTSLSGIGRASDRTPTGESAAVIQHPSSGRAAELWLSRAYLPTSHEGKVLTFGAWVKASQPGQIQLILSGGQQPVTVTSRFHSGSGEWEFISLTKNIIQDDTQIAPVVTISSGTDVEIGGMTIVEGNRILPWQQILPAGTLEADSFEDWSDVQQRTFHRIGSPDGYGWFNEWASVSDQAKLVLEQDDVKEGKVALRMVTVVPGYRPALIFHPGLGEQALSQARGHRVSFGAWVKTTRADEVRVGMQVGSLQIEVAPAGTGEWEWVHVEADVPADSQKVQPWIHGSLTDTVLIDGVVVTLDKEAAPLTLGESVENLLTIQQQPALSQIELTAGRVDIRRMIAEGSLKLIQPDPIVHPELVEGQPAAPQVLSSAVVTYQGKVRENFTYRYDEGGLTLVTDQTGTTRTYDATHRLVEIAQPDGTRYSVTAARDLSDAQRAALQASSITTIQYQDAAGHTQTLDLPNPDLTPFAAQQGEEMTIQSLTRRRLEDGTTLIYNLGRLERIEFPDGRTLSDLTVDKNGIPLRGTLTLADGSTKTIQNGSLVEVTRSDGIKLRYRDNALAEIYVPVNALQDVTLSRVGLASSGQLDSGEVLLPSGDRLTLQGGRFTAAQLSDGAEIRSVNVNQDSLTGATLSVSGSNVTLSDTRDVNVILPSGQEYRYRYKLDSAGRPTNELETMTFRDGFEDGNALGWTVQSGSDWSVTGGDLRARDTESGFSLATTGLNWADYTVTTRFDYESFLEPAKEMAVLFRWQDSNNYYMARVLDRSFQPDRGVGWVLELAGPYFGELIVARLDGFNPSGAHTLSVRCSGSNFEFYLDGEYKGSASNSSLSRGTVGLGVNGSIVRFHDIEVAFPGEDLRDPATRQVDQELRSLRQVVGQAAPALGQVGIVPALFDPASVDPKNVQILEESADPDVRTATHAVQKAAADPSLTLVSEMNAAGTVMASIALDGSTTVYDAQGRPADRYSSDGTVEITYRYGTDGYLAHVTYVAARDRLAQQVALSRSETQRRETAALESLAQQKGFSVSNLQAQVQVTREELINQQSVLRDQLQTLEATDVKGREGRQQKSSTLDQLRQGIDQIQNVLSQLDAQYARSLSDLSSQLAEVKAQVESSAADSFAQIDAAQAEFVKQLLRQELEPILYQQYRIGIGRDPDESEIAQIVNALYAQAGNDPEAALNLAALREQIHALPDYAGRVDEIAAIKSQVADWLTRYVNASVADQQTLAAGLGLAPQEVVPLTSADITRIVDWLNSRSLHFGYSAYLALKELLAAEGVGASDVDLARELILMDVLVGVLNPKVQQAAELELSLFSLERVAQLHGVKTTPSQVSFEDLRSLLAPGPSQEAPPAIAHINGNHYILVQSVAADGTVTYREPNAGPAGQTLTMSQEKFIQQWKGVLLSTRGPPQERQKLTLQETQAITGSFFPLLIILFTTIVSAIGTAVTAVVTAIGALLASLGTLLSGVFSAFSGAIGGIFNGLGAIFSGNLLGGLATIGQGLFTGVTGLINAGLGFLGLGSLSQLGTLAGIKTALTAFALRTVLATGVNMAVSKGLEALGVSPTIAGLTGAFVAGGFTGGFNASGSGMSFAQSVGQGFATAFQSIAIQGTQLELAKVGLDSTLSSLAGIGVGAITGAMLSGVSVPSAYDPVTHLPIPDSQIPWHIANGLEGLGYTLSTQLAPNLAGELAFYGIQKLGESIGLDPRISQLAGIPVRSGISAYLSGIGGEQILTSIGSGLVRGATSIGLEWAAQELDLDPLLGSLTTAGMSGLVESALEGQNPLKGVFDTYFNSINGLLIVDWPGANNFERALYLSKVIDFSRVIQEQGIVAALETYAASIFHRQTIENIWKLGGISDLLFNQDRIEIVTNQEGVEVKRIYTNQEKTDYIELSLDDDRLMGKKEGNVIMHCNYVKGPDGRFVMRNGETEILSKDGTYVVRKDVIKDFKLVEVTRYDRFGNKIEEITPVDSQGILFDEKGEVVNGVQKNLLYKVTTTWQLGKVIRAEMEGPYSPTEEERQMLLDMGYTDEAIAKFSQTDIFTASYGKQTLSAVIHGEDGSLIEVNNPEVKAWLDKVAERKNKIWTYGTRLPGEGIPKTTVEVDRDRGVAQIDMDLTWPDLPTADEIKRIGGPHGILAFNILHYLIRNNTGWNTAVMDGVPELISLTANRDVKFIFIPGVDTDGLTIDQLYQLRMSLNTDKLVLAAHSAGTEVEIRSMFAVKAEKYILMSPRMSPETLYNIMQENGIRSDQVIVVQSWADFPNFPMSYMPYGPSAIQPWTHVFIEGPASEVSFWNPFVNHSIPVDGWLSGENYKIRVNGGSLIDTTIAEVLKDEVNK